MMTDFDSSLAEILGSDWIASGSSTPCRPRLIDDGRIAFGETVFPLSSVANARPSARAGRQAFTAIHDGHGRLASSQASAAPGRSMS